MASRGRCVNGTLCYFREKTVALPLERNLVVFFFVVVVFSVLNFNTTTNNEGKMDFILAFA